MNIAEYIYNSLKIEGNPHSLEDVRRVLDGEDVEEYYSKEYINEIIDLKEALDFLEEHKDIPTVDEIFIKEIHLYAVGSNEDALPGSFKIDDNYTSYNGVSVDYTPADSVCDKIRQMCSNYNNSLKDEESISKLICEFIKIHPFRDGNGRVQRLLLNWALESNGYQPIIIYYDFWKEYIYALNEYRLTGDTSEFIYLIEDKI